MTGKKEGKKPEDYKKYFELLSLTVEELNSLSPDEDIYAFIAGILKHLAPEDTIILVNSFDQDTKTITLHAIEGLGPRQPEVEAILCQPLIGLTFSVPDRVQHSMLTGECNEIGGGLSELTFEWLPCETCNKIEAMSFFGKVYSAGISWKGRLNGAVTFILPRGIELENCDLVTFFIRQVAGFLSRREVEAALKESEERYRAIVNTSPDNITITDLSGTILMVSPASVSMFGLSDQAAANGRSILEFVVPEEEERVRQAMALLIKTGMALGEFHGKRTDGSVFPFEAHASLMRDRAGNPWRMVIVVRDTTLRRQLEDSVNRALARSHNQQQVIFDIAASPLVSSGEVEELSRMITERAAPLLGIERAGVWIFDDPETRLVCIDLFESTPGAHTSGTILLESEFRNEFAALKSAKFINADDPLTDPRTAGYVEGYLKPLRITSMLDAVIRSAGKNIGVICFEHVEKQHTWEPDECTFACQLADQIALAATNRERKTVEEALRESEAKFRLIAENTADNIWIFDMDMHLQYISPSVKKMKGFTVEETLSQSLEEMITPSSLESLMKRFDQEMVLEASGTADPGRTISFETEEYCKSGATILVENSVTFIRDTQGRPVRMLGISRDITERKRAEETLRESEEKLNLALSGSDTGIWKLDIPTMMGTIDDRAAQILGYQQQEIGSHNADWDALSHPEDVPLIQKRLADCLAGRTPSFESEHRMRHASGEWIWVAGKGKITHRLRDGSPLRITGTLQDITGRKRAEEALRKAHDELEIRVQERTAALRESEERLRLKLDSVLSPDSDIRDLELINILDIPAIQSLMEDFTRLTGMATAVLDLKGNVIEATGWQDICTKFHRVNERTAQFCTESDLFLACNLKPGEYVAYKCRNNLWDVVTPLYIGNRHVGNIYTGQFFYDDETIDETIFVAQAEEYGFDREKYLSALHRVPQFSRKQVNNLMDYLVKLTGFVSRLSYSNLKLAKTMAEEKLIRETLRESRQILEAVLNSITVRVFWKDKNLVYLGCNTPFARDAGFERPEDIIGKDDYAMGWREQAERYRSDDLAVITSGISKLRFEEPSTTPSGETIYLLTSKVPLRDTGGEIIGVLCTYLDITDRKRAEEELMRLNTELEQRVFERTADLRQTQEAFWQANKKLNLLSGITRHDIKNQLIVLSGFLELSRRSLEDPARTSEFIEKEKKIAETISHQISFTKDYEDMGVKAPAWQNVTTVIRSVIVRLPVRDIHIDTGDPTLEIYADPLLEKVFYNLIDNALRYGGERMTAIRVMNHDDNGNLVIVIKDDGNGVSTEDKKKLFTKGFGKHTGLGLFLSREILSITGITITENGEPGKGARFEITVPHGQYRFTNQ